jgi:hypothetical protein
MGNYLPLWTPYLIVAVSLFIDAFCQFSLLPWSNNESADLPDGNGNHSKDNDIDIIQETPFLQVLKDPYISFLAFLGAFLFLLSFISSIIS